MANCAAVNLSIADPNNTCLFGESSENVVIPIITLLLNVFGNGFAITSLMHYKLKGDSKTSKVRRSQINWSHADHLNSTNNESPLPEERRLTGDSRNSYRPRKPVVKFGMFHTLVSILAVLDICGALSVSPITIILYIKEEHIEVYGGRGLCHYSAFAMLYLGFTTMAMVMLMSLERLFSIRYAFLYREKASARKAVLAAMIVFGFSAVLCLMPVFGFGHARAMFPHSWCYANWYATAGKDKAFNYLYVTLGILMLLTTLACNALVIKGLLKMRKKLSPYRSSRRRFMSRESQMIIQLIAITTIFVICWAPLMFRILFNQLGLVHSLESDRVSIWLATVNPILDPWVYILCRKSVFQRIKHKIKNIPCMKKLQTTTPSEEIHPPLPLKLSPRLEKLKGSSF